jgi:gas vesicle protein
MEKTTNVVGAMFIGAALGAGAAMLLSPRSGAENRQKIKEAADSTRQRVRRGKESLKEAMGRAREEGQELKEKLADSSKKVMHSAKSDPMTPKLPAA